MPDQCCKRSLNRHVIFYDESEDEVASDGLAPQDNEEDDQHVEDLDGAREDCRNDQIGNNREPEYFKRS